MLSGSRTPEAIFRHEALLYAGQEQFLAATTSFIRDAVAAGEPILVVVSREKVGLLRASIDGVTDAVLFADMAEVGRNPACILPVWRDFVSEHATAGRSVRGIGEPVWADRTQAELVECRHHESLLNVAFAGSPAWWLLCPYDTSALDPAVIDEALRTHPFVQQGPARRESPHYVDRRMAATLFDDPLPPPAAEARAVAFEPGDLAGLRELISRHAAGAGLGGARARDLVLAVNELATNTMRHGGGRGILRVWRDGEALICEVRDRGRISQLLVGRERPATDGAGGRGLWLVNQLCDLVQLRSSSAGTVVRVHMRLS